MGKYSDIMESPWLDTTLYAESIPHLLHYDLAYLWILEKQANLRPRVWKERLEAWRCLVELLLIGELDVKDQPIQHPLLRYTAPNGITKVSWVSLRKDDQQVGVLSPTVLVRPLPDFTSEDLDQWKQRLAEKRRPSDFPFFLRLAIKELKGGQPEGSFRSRLGSLLQEEFAPGAAGNPPAGVSGARLSIPILRKLFWTLTSGVPSSLDNVEILVRAAKNGSTSLFVPRCNVCSYLLTKPRSVSINVEAEHFSVDCENPDGSHSNVLPLSSFLIWVRSVHQVIVWDQRSAITLPTAALPPEPTIEGIQVAFEWEDAQLGGERERRFIKLQFPEKDVLFSKIGDIFYKKILLPGNFEKFSGLPIRLEWFDALQDPQTVIKSADQTLCKVTYQGIQIKGWPAVMNWPFKGNFGVQLEPTLSVGMYPNPDSMPPNWRWYRIFLNGAPKTKYSITTDSSEQILPWLSETRTGSPKVISIVSENGDSGVTYPLKEIVTKFTGGGTANIFMAVDFGTTNTTIYFQPSGETATNPHPDKYGLKPSELSTSIKWLAETDDLILAPTIGDFLPGRQYRKGLVDEYIIPTALWHYQNSYLTRWGPDEPKPGSTPIAGFKWDYSHKDNSPERKAYLKEVLLLTLPLIVIKTALNKPAAKFHVGFAFPLAFDFTARRKMEDLLGEIGGALFELTGFEFVSYSIDESSASVRAFGAHNPGETFLVADMGGGTLDLAFFTFKPHQAKEMHQIGSVRFAGESYVGALAEKKQPNVDRQRELWWKINDSIREGRSPDEYGKDSDAQVILHRFGGLAFEFLRTMIATYRRSQPDKPINLVLVGNGWHLAESFNSEAKTRGPKKVFQEYYAHLVQQLGDEKLTLYQKEPLSVLPSSKHLVVIGALGNALGPQQSMLSEEPSLSKLPAGRALQFTTARGPTKKFDWYDLIGEELTLTGFSSDELKGGKSEFYFHRMPALTNPWRALLLEIFRAADESQIPYPETERLREQIQRSILGDPAKITKGPLQIILEQHWIQRLKP